MQAPGTPIVVKIVEGNEISGLGDVMRDAIGLTGVIVVGAALSRSWDGPSSSLATARFTLACIRTKTPRHSPSASLRQNINSGGSHWRPLSQCAARTAHLSFAAEARGFARVSSGDGRITSSAMPLVPSSVSALERLLDAAIFARVKRQHRNPAAWRQAVGQRAQERVERRELVVHRNAQGLECAANRLLHVGVRHSRPCSDAGHPSRPSASIPGRGRWCCCSEAAAMCSRLWFVCVVFEELSPVRLVESGEKAVRRAARVEGSSACRAARRPCR